VSSIEQRVVEMTFRSAEFLNGVNQSIEALQRLKQNLNLDGAADSLNKLDDAGKRFSLAGLANGVETIASKFSAMGIAGVTAMANIANRAVDAGISMVKSLTIDPIKAGLQDYETKINAIQTILANTSAAGTTLNDVTAALDQLNTYADKTIFNFADMTKNIGYFTAAGVNLQTSVDSIKGISNLAALSGASAEQASGAMYQLSQAISAGKVTLEDWNSVVNAGLGGKIFQDALINTARQHGIAVDDMIKKQGSFRLSLQEGWLTSQVLTETLTQFTGDLSLEQIKAMGYTDQEAQAILKMGQNAVASATNIRTITQLFGTLKEEVASAWGSVWETLIGDINTSTSLLTKVHGVLGNLFTAPVNGLNNFLKGWVELGGKQALIDALSSAFKTLSSIFSTIKGAWKEVFPPATSQDLVDLTVKFKAFVESLKPSEQTLENLKKTFVGLFSILRIGWDVVEGVFSVIGKLFGAVAGGGGGFFALTAKVGDFVVRLREAIESGGALAKFFEVLGNALAFPIKLIGDAIGKVGGLGEAFNKAGDFLSPFIEKIKTAFSGIATAVSSAIQNADWGQIVQVLEGVLGGGVLLSIRSFFNRIGQDGGGGGILSGLRDSFDGLTGALTAMQTNLKADTLQKLAISIGILAASLVVLSFVDVDKLGPALAAITGMMVELLVAMQLVGRVADTSGVVKMAVISGALILLSTAILVLSAAVAILSQFSWEELAKGLAAIAVMLTLLTASVMLMSGNTKGVYASAAAMELMAVAMNVMAIAVGKLGAMDWATLGKGVGTIAALLLAVAGFSRLNAGGMLTTAAGMVVLGAALEIMVDVIGRLSNFSWGEIGKGLATIAASLLIVAGAMQLMPANMLLTSIGLLAVSAALVIMSQALQNMGGMTWGEIAKGLTVLAASLLLIAAATMAMQGALPGAAAILVTAAALAVLAPVLEAFGSMSWTEILKGLTTLAGVFVILGVAGYALAPVAPIVLALGAAVALLGAGVLAAGVGVLAFAAGLTALGVALGVSGAALVAFTASLITLIPAALRAVGEGIIELANVIARGAPAITGAFVAILTALADAIITAMPKIIQAFTTIILGLLQAINTVAPQIIATEVNLLTLMLNAIVDMVPKFVDAGLKIITGVLRGIADNIPKVAQAAGDVVIAFINALGAQALRITVAAADMIITFVNGLAAAIRDKGPELRAAGANLAAAIVDGITGGLAGAVSSVASKAADLARGALNAAKAALGINSPSREFRLVGEFAGQGMVVGLVNSGRVVNRAVGAVAAQAIQTMRVSLSGLGNIVNEEFAIVGPTITPVLDLSRAKQGYSELTALSKDQLINANTSTNKATSISTQNAGATATSDSTSTFEVPGLTFIQNNTSPKALSAGEIYRQTKNQLSVVKGGIPTNAK